MKQIIDKQLPVIILEMISSQEFLKKYNDISWLSEHERIDNIQNVEVGANSEILSNYEIDSTDAPTFRIKYLVFQLTDLKRIQNQKEWLLGSPGLRVVGTISDLELKLESSFDDNSNRLDKFKIVNASFEIDKLAFHPR
jgi:hypothetical protein